jgi:hypothetical protein
MGEMIATYSSPPWTAAKSAVAAPSEPANGNGRGYLNEVSPLTARSASSEDR